MQLTRLDRWLQEKFVHETHVYTMRPPAKLPPRVRHQELPEQPGRQYHHLYIARSGRSLESLLDILKTNGQMFATRVVHRKAWYVPFLAPNDNRSVTWWIVNKTIIAFVALALLGVALRMWDNPETRANLLDSLRILKE